MKNDLELLKEAHKKSFNFFYNEICKEQIGYGLIYDNSSNKNVASIAASGFALSSICIGVECGYISRNEGLEIAIKSLETLLQIEHMNGFFVHFIEINTLKKYRKTEYSTIDTALCLNGVITVDSYFKDERISKMANHLIERVDYEWLVHEHENKKYFHMAYNPESDGAYANGRPGFISRWDMTAEQLMMYVFAANNIDEKLAIELYNSFDRPIGEYQGIKQVHSPGNALFIYQYPLAWLDLREFVDRFNFSWYQNTINACRICYNFCVDMKGKYRSYHEQSFGISASDTPNGYRVFGGPPRKDESYNTDGTVCVHAFLGSLPFIPQESIDTFKWASTNIGGLDGEYGLYDAYNIDSNWVSNRYYGIDKGLELLMLDAYLYKTVWSSYIKHPIITNGLRVLGFKKNK